MNLQFTFVILMASGSSCLRNDPCKVTVYYIPLDIEFYGPATPEHLQKYGDHLEERSFSSVCELIEKVQGMRDSRQSSGEEDRMRVQIIDLSTREEFFITAEREIIWAGRVFAVSDEILSAALREIEEKVE